MRLKLVGSIELKSALGASVVFHVEVSPHVIRAISECGKCFDAELTFERSFLGMNAHMCLQTFFVEQIFTTSWVITEYAILDFTFELRILIMDIALFSKI